MATTYQPFKSEGDEPKVNVVVQPAPIPLQAVVQPQPNVIQPNLSRPDDGIMYWLACIFCNYCGLGYVYIDNISYIYPYINIYIISIVSWH